MKLFEKMFSCLTFTVKKPISEKGKRRVTDWAKRCPKTPPIVSKK